MANSKTIKERLAILETKMDGMNAKLNTLINNHLPHIETRIGKLEYFKAKAVGYAAGVGAAVGIIIHLVSKYLFS